MPEPKPSANHALTCAICGRDYSAPCYEVDAAFAHLFDWEPGETCDACTEVVVNGSAEDLEALLAKHRGGAS